MENLGTHFTYIITGGSGLLFVIVGIPLWLRRIKPNSHYGFRIQQTLDDEDTWYEVNALTGRQLVIVGAICLVICLGLLPFSLTNEMSVCVLTGFTAVLVVGVVWIVITGHTLAVKRGNEKIHRH
jgi:uncharacterized membrane protein